MKWLRAGLLTTVLLFVLLIPLPVLADTSAEVTVTATGYICEAPGGFTLTYISDHEVGISWTKGADAENTMVRAAYGRMPESRTDGYLVYYGENSYASDTAVSLDETATAIYYRAWSQAESGVWEEEGSSGWIEGIGMTLIALIILALGFTTTGYIFRRTALAFAACGAWTVLGFYSYTISTGNFESWDIWYALFWLCMALVIVSAFEPIIMKPAKEEMIPMGMEEEEDDDKELRDDFDKMNRQMGKVSMLLRGGGEPSEKAKGKKKMSKFAKTGEE